MQNVIINMMLNKNVCKKCYEREDGRGTWNKAQIWGSTKWFSADSLWKEKGKVICLPLPLCSTERGTQCQLTFVEDGPPKKCPFILEHLVSMHGVKSCPKIEV